MKVKVVKDINGNKLTNQDIPFKEEKYSSKAEPKFFKQRFICAGYNKTTQELCDAETRASPRYLREMETMVRGHFFLAPGAQHVEGCIMNPLTGASEVQAKYQDAITYDNDRFILTIPAEEQWKVDLPTKISDEQSVESEQPDIQRRTTTRPSGRTCARYILMAAKEIATLLNYYKDDEEAQELFCVQYESKTLKWEEFFHDLRTGAEGLYKLALKNQRQPQIPLAVYGRILAVYEAAGGVRNHTVIIANSKRTQTPAKKVMSVKIYTEDSEVLKLKPGTDFLGLGFWAPWSKRPEQLRIFAEPGCYVVIEDK